MKRILAFVLALFMMLSSFALIISCSEKEEDDKKNENKDDGIKEDDGSIFYERSLVDDGLDEKDYGGKTFRVVGLTGAMTDFTVPEEERNKGDLVLDAKFAASEKVQNRFNMNFEVVYSSNSYQELDAYVQKTVLSASDEFDVMSGMVMSMGGLVIKNLFLNWYEIDHIDFSKPWWYESNRTELTYDGKAIIAISHLNHWAVTGSYGLFYNKDLAASYDFPDLYKVVLDGKWTFDKFHELVKDVYRDLNGNDERDVDDFYGMTQGTGTNFNSYLWGFDNSPAKMNSEGVPEVTIKTDKIESIVQEIYDFCYNTDGVFCDPDGQKAGSVSYVGEMFYAKRSIFMQMNIGEALGEKMRNFDNEYGLLPLPKWDENQTDYMTMVGGHHTALAVPKTIKDPEFVGRIIEAMSAESWKLVTPTIYEIALKTRYLRDSESKEVLDIIIEGTQFDFGSVYDNWQGFAFTLQMLVGARKNNFTSYHTSKTYSAKTQIKNVIKAFDKLI
jgi:hypothetical protein